MRRTALTGMMLAFFLSGSTFAADETIPIQVHSTPPPSPITRKVPDGTLLTLAVTKRPNETCALELQREETKAAPEPISNFIAVLVKAFVPAAGAPTACPPVPAAPNVPLATQLKARLDALEAATNSLQRAAETDLQDFKNAGLQTERLVSCREFVAGIGPRPAPECSNAATYSGQVRDVIEKLGAAVDKPLPSTEGVETQLAHVNELLKKLQENDTIDPDWLSTAYERATCAAARIRRIKDIREQLVALRDAAGKILQRLNALDVQTAQTLSLPRDENSKVTGKLTCKNAFTDTATTTPVPISVTYESVPRFTLTAGLLYSWIDKRKIGTEPEQAGDTTFVTRVTASESSGQFVPFSFLDLRLKTFRVRETDVRFNFGVGVGVNSNNGSKEVEYFVGPSVAVKNIHLHIGLHRGKVAEPAGGYAVGDVVPSEKFPGVPVKRQDEEDLAIAISYRLPLG